ncbi:MAG: hypothetical protein CMI55_04015 [Parcubacteria group bacterium]|jgi:hypothetical protein|nr:hypothetical protein [Parcubacteria group bacterium]|tara:strand:+ start:9661 stop:10467 length:807 start_codon:yes stop_codon:yes gene_type:complete
MRHKYKKKKKKSSLRRIIFRGLFFCILVGLAYFLIWSPFFWVKEIEVNQAQFSSQSIEIVQDILNQRFWKLIPQKSIFLVSADKIRTEILDRFPEIKQVAVIKKIPRRLEVIIDKREKIGIWCQIEWLDLATSTGQILNRERKINQCFQIDNQGVIFKESPLISGSMILNIYSQDQSVQIRDEVISSEIVDFVIAVNKGLSLRIDDFELISIEDLKAKTSAGWHIYFNPSYSADAQIKALEAVLESEIQDPNSLEYIDLRIENRVYYK